MEDKCIDDSVKESQVSMLKYKPVSALKWLYNPKHVTL